MGSAHSYPLLLASPAQNHIITVILVFTISSEQLQRRELHNGFGFEVKVFVTSLLECRPCRDLFRALFL